jgi:hypothetical protein
MLWSFTLILLLTTGEIERYESPPLLHAECLLLRREKQTAAEQRMDLRGLLITPCQETPAIT